MPITVKIFYYTDVPTNSCELKKEIVGGLKI